MSLRKKLLKALQSLWKQILQLSRSITQRLRTWLLRSWLVLGRRARFSSAGFVLPTVVMVILVVVLVTTAMVYRSIDRAKNASNVRVNQRVLAAVNPALDRAQAKINALLADPTLPRGTPTDQALYGAMTGSLSKYTLGDEKPLKLVYDVNGGGINRRPATLDEDESLATAWRFPLDTDNDGTPDSYTLYGIYFRNPTTSANRARSPLEARSIPMDNPTGGNDCGAGTAASLVGNSGWYKNSDGNLKKSFFVFAATVPMTNIREIRGEQQPYKGNKGFAAIELQQDQSRIPLTNNAVVYDDDLEITPGAGLKINGRIMTNGNLLIGRRFDPVQLYQVSSTESCFYSEENGKITVGGNVVLGSADGSTNLNPAVVDLFDADAEPEHETFTAANGSVNNPPIKASYNSKAYAERIDDLVQRSRPNPPPEVRQNVRQGLYNLGTGLQNYFKERTRRVPFAEVPARNPNALAGGGAPIAPGTNDMRPRDTWMYPTDLNSGTENNALTLRKNQPPATNPEERSETKEDRLGDRILVGNGLPAKWWNPNSRRFVDFYDQFPQEVQGATWDDSNEPRTRMTQVVPLSDIGDTARDGFWERKAADKPDQPLDGVGGLRVVTGAGIYDARRIASVVPPGFPSTLTTSDTGATQGSFLPPPLSPVRDDPSTVEVESFITPTIPLTGPQNPQGFTVVLPDSMPMWEDSDVDGRPSLPPDTLAANSANKDRRGDLVMRATAVYHYRASNYPNPPGSPYPIPARTTVQRPIACVSSYYDPSTSLTARNRAGLPAVDSSSAMREQGINTTPPTLANNGRSHNGISYPPPTIPSFNIPTGTQNARGVFITPAPVPPTTGTANVRGVLNYQANLIFPDGRFVNRPLREALIQRDLGQPLTLAHQSAIDSALCALQIRTRVLTPRSTVIPHGAIYETTFLDARQVKSVENEPLAQYFENPRPATAQANYDLSLEERQPLEIRATVIDLNLLRRTQILSTTGSRVVPAPEYLLPDSGIIYATRDDALQDLSDPGGNPPPLNSPPNTNAGRITATQRLETRKINSPVDFVLDPTRRPNAIMLVNGSKLSRGTANNWKPAGTEKGLILASNLPVYVKADDNNRTNHGFNLHQNASSGAILEEFSGSARLATRTNWSDADFYGRPEAQREFLFACRNNQPGLPRCSPGDSWRPATVIADSVTLLSNNFRFGFRNQGDYDLRKNVENFNNNLVVGGYDIDGDRTTDIPLPFGETAAGIDLNGNGTIQPDPVAPIVPSRPNVILESQVTVTAARRLNGFFDNNYLTSADWYNTAAGANQGFPRDFEAGGSGTPNTPDPQGSSYVNNFVTPIQRRATFPEYVMEICRKRLVEECGPNDWVVNINGGPDVEASTILANTPVAQLLGNPTPSPGTPGAGTTAQLPRRPADRGYPRRVAFLRDPATNNLVLDAQNRPTVLGIAGGEVQYYSYAAQIAVPGGSSVVGAPPPAQNALWFRTTSTPANPSAGADYGNGPNRPLFLLRRPGDGTTEQPLLVPVLQIHSPKGDPTPGLTLPPGPDEAQGQSKTWMQKPLADDTTFNLIIAAGDSPSRDNGFLGAPGPEFNGGLPNFPVFLEDWRRRRGAEAGVSRTEARNRISGSFIQIKRSGYATAPFLSVVNPPTPANSIFGYPQTYRTDNNQLAGSTPNNAIGRVPYYYPPNRQWGFDVGLLSQLPDLFSQQITTPSAGEPNKFYRELSRDDAWVKTLLCAAVGQRVGTTERYTYGQYAVEDPKQRPTDKSQNRAGGCLPVPYPPTPS